MESADRPRFLGKVVGYVEHAGAGMRAEPEAVSETEQAMLTERSAKQALDARIKRREATADELRREQQWLESRLRYIGRELKRLRRVAR